MRRIKPWHDVYIKYLFGCFDHNPILLDFINAIRLDSQQQLFTDVLVKNPVIDRSYPQDKKVELDIKAVTSFGEFVNLEVESLAFNFSNKRIILYLAKILNSQMDKGAPYSQLEPVIGIYLVNFNHLDGTQYPKAHNWFNIRSAKYPHHPLTNLLSLHFVELPKIPENFNPDFTPLECWLYYFKYEGIPEKEVDMSKVAEKHNPISKARQEYKNFTKESNWVEWYDAEEKRLRDEISRDYLFKEAQKKLIEEQNKANEAQKKAKEARSHIQEIEYKAKMAFDEGGKAMLIKTINTMIQNNMTLESISNALSIPLNEIKELLEYQADSLKNTDKDN